MKRGFSLIEVMIAVFLLTVGVTAGFTLIQNNIMYASLNRSKLTAYYLAQEGIELVRNIRENNLLSQREDPLRSWSEGIGVGNWEIDWDHLTLTPYLGRRLYIEAGDNFYTYIPNPSQQDEETPYTRMVSVSQITPDDLRISVKIQWSEKQKNREVEVTSELTRWR